MHLQQTLGWFEAVAKLSSFARPSQKTLHRTRGESSTMVIIKTKRVSLNNIFFNVLLPILFDCGQAVSIDQNVLFCRPLGHTLSISVYQKFSIQWSVSFMTFS